MTAPLPRIDGYTFFPGPTEDGAELTSLIHAVQRSADRQTLAGEDMVAALISEPDIVQVRVTDTSTSSLVGYLIYENPAPHVMSRARVWVHPDAMGRGIGSTLTEWAIDRARADLPKAPGGTRVTHSSSPRDGGDPARRLLEELGFMVERWFLEMTVKLDDDPIVASTVPGITIRNTTDADGIEVIADTQHDAFRDHYGWVDSPAEQRHAEWQHWRSSELWENELGWLAEGDGETVAMMTALNQYGTDETTGYIAVLGVRQPWRGRGVAKALLTTAFSKFQERDKEKVVLHVDADSLTGATQLYRSVGMRETDRNPSYEIEIRAGDDIRVR